MINDFNCKDRGLHNYSHKVGEDNDMLTEKCVWCGHVIHFIKCEGAIDQTRYGKAHKLDFLQENDKEWERYYGKINPNERGKKAKPAELL